MEKTKSGLFIVWSVKQRIAHIVLFLGVLIAVLTGIPLKYYDYGFAVSLLRMLGGYAAIRLLHNAMGMLVIFVLIFHLSSIAYVWLRTENFIGIIDMKITKDDFKNILDVILYILFIKKKPEFGRYTLFEKMDYFVSLICLIVLAVTGLVLEFPIAITSFISISWLPISHHLHSSTAVFFTIYVILGHIFNAHLHPEKLYLNDVWLFGTLNEEEMKELHYLEYKKVLEKEVSLREEFKRKAEEKSKESMIKKEKKMLEDYLREGNELAQAGNYPQAVEKYKEAIEIYPNYSQARFNLGVVYKKNKQYDEAIKIFKEFVNMDPFNKMVDVAKASIEESRKLMNEPKKNDDDGIEIDG